MDGLRKWLLYTSVCAAGSFAVGRMTAPSPAVVQAVPTPAAIAEPALTRTDLADLQRQLDQHEKRLNVQSEKLGHVEQNLFTYNEMTATLAERVVPMRPVGKPVEFRATLIKPDSSP